LPIDRLRKITCQAQSRPDVSGLGRLVPTGQQNDQFLPSPLDEETVALWLHAVNTLPAALTGADGDGFHDLDYLGEGEMALSTHCRRS
jgi:hypothetical protein